MRRILLLFSAVAIMAVVFAGPALANHEWWHFDDDDDDFGGFNFDGGGELGFADQELESGDVENVADISIDGNNNNQCVGLSQFGNTSNFVNQQGTSTGDGGDGGFDDDDNNHDDDDWWNHDDDDDSFVVHHDNGEFASEFSGGEFDFAPENETSCEQAVQQAAAASSF